MSVNPFSDQHNSSSCITFRFSFKNTFAWKTNNLSSNFICQNLDKLFPQYIFNLAVEFASSVLLSLLVAPTYLDYFKMPLFRTTWRKLQVTSVDESELKLFERMGAGVYPHAFCKICGAARTLGKTSLYSGPLTRIKMGKIEWNLLWLFSPFEIEASKAADYHWILQALVQAQFGRK